MKEHQLKVNRIRSKSAALGCSETAAQNHSFSKFSEKTPVIDNRVLLLVKLQTGCSRQLFYGTMIPPRMPFLAIFSKFSEHRDIIDCDEYF